ncbi:hypothetical protein GQ43DRAFT_438319 [Delitschia confertaspora ATCC 74209]|uniref:Lecithin:cholesterol acyltransferase n=1 Tax=Delitschia confertaspora ATCC 74209 TaxID=1513339 RepID=A0A9P4JRT2_9PLEO|nr:hypothetical protein GQ43DRAFT_438319 [Delitschia confertaspora ATCC 74209]
MTDSYATASYNQNARQNALAEIQFASLIDPNLTTSEDDTLEEDDIQAEDAQSVIGVSISPTQTHLASPWTPVEEKRAALEDIDDGEELFMGTQPPVDGTNGAIAQEQQRPSRSTHVNESSDDSEPPQQTTLIRPRDDGPPPRLPSPWRATPKTFQKLDDHRAVLRKNLSGRRKRAASGGSTTETLRKYMSFNLPSMPKSPNRLNFSLPSFSVSSALDMTNSRGRALTGSRKQHVHDHKYKSMPDVGDGTSPSGSLSRASVSPNRTANTAPSLPPEPQMLNAQAATAPVNSARNPPLTLRRSASDNSLVLYRSLSIASSLGDDSRFENVQEQVNSRIKAIKDSWQDANFKLPSMPSLPNFNFGSKEDIFKSKNSVLPRSSTLNTHGTSHLNSTVGTKGLPLRLVPGKPASQPASSSTNPTQHPFFSKALEELTGDVVVLGGYRGSILRSAEPPHRQLWVPIKVGLNLRKVDLEVGLNLEDEETMEERVIPGGMLSHIGPVDISRRLFKRLRGSANAKNGTLRVHDYGYDWRLSPHLLSRNLRKFLAGLPCNAPGTPVEKRGAIVIAHSLGGLITRHAVNQQPDLFAGVVYAGVPQTCVNILGPFRNGDDVMLSSRVLTAQVNFTIRTSYALLPLDGKCFFNKYTKEEYPVDFFDVNTWKEYRLSPCIAAPLPAPNSQTNGSMSGLLNAMSSALPSFPHIRKHSISKSNSSSSNNAYSGPRDADPVQQARDAAAESSAQTTGVAPQMNSKHMPTNPSATPTPSTAVTIPYDKALEYLTRTLAEVKDFKENLAFRAEHAKSNIYPPIALIYGKSTPTVYGAKVESREAIKRADAYDELAFASGDGVVLAKAAMVPEGYSVVRGGVVSSDRGHVTLLGDLEAVGRCLSSVIEARRKGVGMRRGER